MSLLPDKKSVPKQNFHEYMKLYYGAPSTGKTSTAAQNDDAIFLMFEDGIAGLSVYNVNIPKQAKKLGKRQWEVFLDLIEELLNEEHNFNEVVIDSGDRGIDACFNYTEEINGYDDLTTQGFGKGWQELRKNFTKQ